MHPLLLFLFIIIVFCVGILFGGAAGAALSIRPPDPEGEQPHAPDDRDVFNLSDLTGMNFGGGALIEPEALRSLTVSQLDEMISTVQQSSPEGVVGFGLLSLMNERDRKLSVYQDRTVWEMMHPNAIVDGIDPPDCLEYRHVPGHSEVDELHERLIDKSARIESEKLNVEAANPPVEGEIPISTVPTADDVSLDPFPVPEDVGNENQKGGKV